MDWGLGYATASLCCHWGTELGTVFLKTTHWTKTSTFSLKHPALQFCRNEFIFSLHFSSGNDQCFPCYKKYTDTLGMARKILPPISTVTFFIASTSTCWSVLLRTSHQKTPLYCAVALSITSCTVVLFSFRVWYGKCWCLLVHNISIGGWKFPCTVQFSTSFDPVSRAIVSFPPGITTLKPNVKKIYNVIRIYCKCKETILFK